MPTISSGRPKLLSAMLALVFAVGLIATGSASAAPLATSGMNGWTVLQLSAQQRDRQLAAMQAHGVQVVRSDAPWSYVQPLPPSAAGPGWQWAQTDAWASAMAAHHLTWEPLLDFSVWWAKTCPGFCAPTSDSTFAAYAQAVAARYGPGGSFWAENPKLPYYPAQIFEVWNEENVSTYYVAPARFATLYSASRTAIHAVAPSAKVIIGGLADDSSTYDASQDYPAQYVRAMFAAAPTLKGNVDGFGLHPYGATAADVQNWTVDFRHTLNALGEASTPIYITELGWTTGDSNREFWRAWMMGAVATNLSRSDCGIQLLEPYDWMGPADPNGDYGLVDDPLGFDANLRQAGTAWFNGLTKAASMPKLNICG
ncbi:MAG TPA: hypothetical protein VGF81_07395 [Solirubrobacteraceae bacterium]|jgi:hypothetical protein